MLSSPASLTEIRNSSIDSPVRTEPLTISIGEYAWTCMSGTRSLTARTRSAYAVPGRSGWIPPCMQTSVAPITQASSARWPTSSIDSE